MEKIYVEPHKCEICSWTISLGSNELTDIRRNGDCHYYHTECFESVITPDLSFSDDIVLDFPGPAFEDAFIDLEIPEADSIHDHEPSEYRIIKKHPQTDRSPDPLVCYQELER